MEISLSERIRKVDDQLFFLLGQLPDQTWHHRIIRAPDPLVAHQWWIRQTGLEPAMLLIQPELEAALAGLVALCEQVGSSGVWGGWFISNTDSSQMKMTTVSAGSYEQARELISQDAPAGFTLATIVEPTPWIAEVARMRAIAAGQMDPDVDLIRP